MLVRNILPISRGDFGTASEWGAALLNNVAEVRVALPLLSQHFSGSDEQFVLFCCKLAHPYTYMQSWGRYDEAALPPREAFYSELSESTVSEEEYNRTGRIFEKYCPDLGRLTDLY